MAIKYRIGFPGQDSKDRTCRTKQIGQDNENMTAKTGQREQKSTQTGQLRHDSWDKIATEGGQDCTARIGNGVHEGQNMTARIGQVQKDRTTEMEQPLRLG
jgi:hypothetical protein